MPGVQWNIRHYPTHIILDCLGLFGHIDLMNWPISEAKTHIGTLLIQAETDGVQLITKRGKPVGYVLSPEDYKALTGNKTFKQHLAKGRLHELPLERSDESARSLPW